MKTSSADAFHIELSDLAAAALLVAEGAGRVIDLVPTDVPGRVAFVVVGEPDRIDGLLRAYERGEAVVALEPFLAAQRRLKERLFRHERLGRVPR